MSSDEIIRKFPKIVTVKRSKYFSYRNLVNVFHLIEGLELDARQRERDNERKEIENRPKNTGFLSSLFEPRRKPKSEEYWKGYKAGAFDAIELCKHYFVSNAISKEKEQKLIDFLHENGINICVNPVNGGIMICDMYNAGEFIECKIVYEDK